MSTVVVTGDVAGECSGFCATVEVSNGRRGVGGLDVVLESDVDGPIFGSRVVLDADGRGSVCVPGPLSPGAHEVTAPCDGCTPEPSTLTVTPFGRELGLAHSAEVLAALPWVPEPVGDVGNPRFVPDPEGWDAIATMAPSVIRFGGEELLYYAGQAEDTAFALGVAARPEGSDGAFVRDPEPLTSLQEGEGGWNAYGQQAPEVLEVDGALWMYYTGASLSDGGLHIGLATSEDGHAFVNHPEGPVLAPTDDIGDFDWRGVGHPSVVIRDGVFEMWYASGTLALGYAVSEDGIHFERYCGNPVFEGLGADSWDQAQVKSPEVVHHAPSDTYYMTWSGCDPCFQVGWAASRDGIRWVSHPDPILPATGDGWEGVAVQSAFIQELPDVWRLWYTGNDGRLQSIGAATIPAGPG